MSLHSWKTSSVLGVIALVIWFTAFFWYFYGAGRVARRFHELLVWLHISR
jgi:hypothetical protein